MIGALRTAGHAERAAIAPVGLGLRAGLGESCPRLWSSSAVFLKSLTLKGFKSFADATTLQLEPGVTVVVGPNGSGKSNVVDAIAWVLGAQAPSAVRSQKMDDVIFAGTAKRPALGRAEVSLTIDNSAGLLPIEFTEVTVSRILFRTGESEYSINGVTCRLLDVQELLSDAGVGRQQHVIVSQGQIDAVLNARPEERRSIIEEAAGVLKFRRRKERAERRLDATEASLLRVQDLLREVRRQLRPLERQAEAARRHGDLVTELSALQIYPARARDRFAAHSAGCARRRRRSRCTPAEQELRAELAASRHQRAGRRGRADRAWRPRSLRRDGARRAVARTCPGHRRRAGRTPSFDGARSRPADGLRRRRQPRVRRQHACASSWRRSPTICACSARKPRRWQPRKRSSAPSVSRRLVTIDSVVASSSAASAAAEVRGELRSLRGGADRAESELQRLRSRLDMLRERVVRLDADAERLRVECEQAQVVEAGSGGRPGGRREPAGSRQKPRTNRPSRHARQRPTTRRDGAHAPRRLHLALESARARAGAEHLAGVDEVLGTLLDLIDIDSGWEAAVEAALGEALEAVVVASPHAGRRALDSLHASNVHGAVLALGAATGVIRAFLRPTAYRCVPTCAAAIRGGRIAGRRSSAPPSACSTWADAIDVAIANPHAVVVTDDGDRFGPTAGGSASPAAGQRRRRWRRRRSVWALRQPRSRVASTRRADGAESSSTRLVSARHELSRQLDTHDAGVLGELRRAGPRPERAARHRRPSRDRSSTPSPRPASDWIANASGSPSSTRWCRRSRPTRLPRPRPRRSRGEHAPRLDARARAPGQSSPRSGGPQRRPARAAAVPRAAAGGDRAASRGRCRRSGDTPGNDASRSSSRSPPSRTSSTLVERHRDVIETRHDELMEIRRKQSDEVRGIAQRLDDLRRRRGAAEKSSTRSASARAASRSTRPRSACGWRAPSRRCAATTTSSRRAAEAAELPTLPEGISRRPRVCATSNASCA